MQVCTLHQLRWAAPSIFDTEIYFLELVFVLHSWCQHCMVVKKVIGFTEEIKLILSIACFISPVKDTMLIVAQIQVYSHSMTELSTLQECHEISIL